MGKGYTLCFVESPGKCKKIKEILESAFGRGFEVMASVGHIIDLDTKDGIDISNNFKPNYQINKDKFDVVNKIKKAASSASDILIATDEDREGEMIAWSLAYVLKLEDPKRIVFNSITKTELTKAVKNPRGIDYNLVDAQKARRELDMIIGFELSPLLWKSIGASLSAGRVQSVVLRLIVDKENDIKGFFSKGGDSYFKINGTFLDTKNKHFTAQLYQVKDKNDGKEDNIEDNMEDEIEKDNDEEGGMEKNEDVDAQTGSAKGGTKAKISTEDGARGLMRLLMESKFKIGDITEKESSRYPSPPFTTSTLQQEASRKLGMSIQRTMRAAQNLYEAGYITYMRTDSVSLSGDALSNIKKYVIGKYGKDYHRQMNYKSKTANTQEAHEAIRPTDAFVENVEAGNKIGSDEIRLYSLIWKRTIASQMSPAKLKIITVQIIITKTDEYFFVTQIENIIFYGFLVVYNVTNVDNEKDRDEDNNLGMNIPKLGSPVNVDNIVGNQEYQKPPARFNEASLVNKLDPKNLNIGRPATYQSIITKIQNRGYVKIDNVEGMQKDATKMVWESNTGKLDESVKKIVIGKESNKFIPTELGKNVTNFLVKNFPEIMDYKFTADMECELDEIAEGKIKWIKVMDKFYKKFHPIVENLLKNASEKIGKDQKLVGVHPQTGHNIYAENGYYGPIIRMSTHEGRDKIGPIKEPLTIDSITIDEAVNILKYPENLGKYGRRNVILKTGKYGLYLECGDITVSLAKEGEGVLHEDPEDITLEGAIELIKDKEKDIFFDQKEGKIRYTVQLTDYGLSAIITGSTGKKKYVKLNTNTDVESLTLEKVKELIKGNTTSKYKREAVRAQGSAPAANKNNEDNQNDNQNDKGGTRKPRAGVPKVSKKTSKNNTKKVLVKGKSSGTRGKKIVNLFNG